MAISKVADRATGLSTAVQTTVDLSLSSLTVGNVLIIRAAVDNTGGGGAARSVTVTNQSGTAIDTSTDEAFQQNNDPGSSGAGITINVIVAVITATSGTVRLTYSGAAASNVIAEEWSGILTSDPVVGTPVGNTDTTTALPALTDSSVASGNMAYAAVAIEAVAGDTITADSDTSNGSWVELTKAAAAATAEWCYGAYKVVTGTGSQTHNGTISTGRDSAGLILELAAITTVSATLAAPLGGVTGSASATVQHEATLAAPLNGTTGAATATVQHEATLAAPLGEVAAAASATVQHEATLAAPLGGVDAHADATVESGGPPTVEAVLDAPLGGVSGSASATVQHEATVAAPLGGLTSTAAASVQHDAVLAAPLGGLTAELSATVEEGNGEPEPVAAVPDGSGGGGIPLKRRADLRGREAEHRVRVVTSTGVGSALSRRGSRARVSHATGAGDATLTTLEPARTTTRSRTRLDGTATACAAEVRTRTRQDIEDEYLILLTASRMVA